MSTGTFTVADARADLLDHLEDIYAVEAKNGSVRRRTLSEQRLGGFWVMYWWGLKGYELHVHYKDSGAIKTSDVKVVGSNMRGGEVHLDSHQLALVRPYIKNPGA